MTMSNSYQHLPTTREYLIIKKCWICQNLGKMKPIKWNSLYYYVCDDNVCIDKAQEIIKLYYEKKLKCIIGCKK